MPETLTPEQERARRLDLLDTIAERAIPFYAYTVTPEPVRDALARLDDLRERKAALDDLVAVLRAELAGLDARDEQAAKEAVRDGKPVPKRTARGPLETKLAEAERAQLAMYQVAADASGAVRAASIAVRADWRANICAVAEEKRTEALTAATQLAALMDELASLALTVESMDDDLAHPWGPNEQQWRSMAMRGGITWNADRAALDRIVTDRLEYSTTYPGGLPGRLNPAEDPTTEHNPMAGPSAPLGTRGD
ncbi:hypothetical protein ABT093_01305 [Kitasatospora sp. NPDC002551]|uniref:hypothetical protein n=1 Tax=Kitasatospora sp. NPDC002551 TaxID=3154539 RepID=UPI00331D357F